MQRRPPTARRRGDSDVHVLGALPLREASARQNAEEFRVVAKRYGDEDVLDLRTYYQGRDGTWRPTQRGTLLPRAAAAFLLAALRAIESNQSPQATATRAVGSMA